MKWMRLHVRTLIQVAFTALTNGYVNGFVQGKIFGGSSKALCVPGLSCYSCPGALGACPIGALQAVLGDWKHSFSYYVVGFLMAVGALCGRFVCGFLCPFGLVQDLLYKIPFPVKRNRLPGERWLRWVKYAVLAVFVIILPLTAVNIVGQGDPWFCKWICPSGTLMGGIPLVSLDENLRKVIGSLFQWKMLVLLVVLFGSIVMYRPFCKYLCPLGAIYSLFNPIALYRFRLDESACVHCGACKRACNLGLDPTKGPNSPECIRCGDCMRACPTNAIVWTTPLDRRKAGPCDGACKDCAGVCKKP